MSSPDLARRLAAAFPFDELLWMHTVALRRRAFSRTPSEWEEHDHMVGLLCEAIPEHIVREEVDVGADSFDQT